MLTENQETGSPKATQPPKAEVISLTPDLAKECLMHNSPDNRNMSKRHLDYLVKEIQENRWVFDGSPLRFNTKGEMIYGQCRCHAVINTGETIPVVKVEGILEKTFEKFDIFDPKKAASVKKNLKSEEKTMVDGQYRHLTEQN